MTKYLTESEQMRHYIDMVNSPLNEAFPGAQQAQELFSKAVKLGKEAKAAIGSKNKEEAGDLLRQAHDASKDLQSIVDNDGVPMTVSQKVLHMNQWLGGLVDKWEAMKEANPYIQKYLEIANNKFPNGNGAYEWATNLLDKAPHMKLAPEQIEALQQIAMHFSNSI